MRYTGDPGARRRPSLTFEILPPPGWCGRWTIGRKAALLRAIASGQVSLDEARQRYSVSLDELAQWRDDHAAAGMKGLRVSRQEERARRRDGGVAA